MPPFRVSEIRYSPGHVECPQCHGKRGIQPDPKCYTCKGKLEIPYREWVVWGRCPDATYRNNLGDPDFERMLGIAVEFKIPEILQRHGVPECPFVHAVNTATPVSSGYMNMAKAVIQRGSKSILPKILKQLGRQTARRTPRRSTP